MHDPDKVAICKDYLLQGKCAFGNSCDLSHEPTPNRVPACVHFLRGGCTNENCRYAHVKVNPNAPVCNDYARLGYCEKGIHCKERHITECPEYANTGVCTVEKCRLPHVDRAGQIRRKVPTPDTAKATYADKIEPAVVEVSETSLPTDTQVLSSDEDDDEAMEDVNSEEEVILPVADTSFQEQQDYISL
jgi:hypothetical protein